MQAVKTSDYSLQTIPIFKVNRRYDMVECCIQKFIYLSIWII